MRGLPDGSPLFQKNEIALKYEAIIAKQMKENQGTRTDLKPSDQMIQKSTTRKELAKIAGTLLLFGVLGISLKRQTALGDVTSDKCVSCKLSKGLPEKGMTGCRDCLQKADRRGYLNCVKIKHN